MTQNTSLADRAVMALSMVKDITDGLANDAPERHVIRAMQQAAMSIMADAFRNAAELAYRAGELRELIRETKDATEKSAIALKSKQEF